AGLPATSGLPAPSRAGPAPSRAGPAATRRWARRDRAGLLVRLHADRPDPRHRRLRPVSAWQPRPDLLDHRRRDLGDAAVLAAPAVATVHPGPRRPVRVGR